MAEQIIYLPGRFALHSPLCGQRMGGVIPIAGWYIRPANSAPRLRAYLNDQPAATLTHGTLRPDVAAAFGNRERTLASGFWGELALPDGFQGTATLAIHDEGLPPQDRRLAALDVEVNPFQHRPRLRSHSFDLLAILRCSECGQPLVSGSNALQCPLGHTFPVIAGAPAFHDPGEATLYHLQEKSLTHPYGEGARRVITHAGDAPVLDFGAGNPAADQVPSNVLLLDARQYHITDVVCTSRRLPFADNTFGGIITQAVFEHLADPHHVARELHRILKPGGRIYIDTAFNQPLHGDPSHFFNMTIEGLRRVAAPFRELTSGVAPYQYPSKALRIQVQTVLPHVEDPRWKDRLTSIIQLLNTEGDDLDKALGPRGREILAAGVYFEGTK